MAASKEFVQAYTRAGLIKVGDNPVVWSTAPAGRAVGFAAGAALTSGSITKPSLLKKKSSFKTETAAPDAERAKALAAFRDSVFSKSLTAEEITAVDPETGAQGKWVRPNVHYDPSPEHVPPPPPEPIPEELLSQPPPPPDEPVPLQALDPQARTKRMLLTKRSSGVFQAPPPPPPLPDGASSTKAVAFTTGASDRAPSKPSLLKKKSSFKVEVSAADERAKALAAFGKGIFSKSLTAEEITAIDPETGVEGKWVRPNLHYDPSPAHVPPPPPGPIPAEVLAQPKPTGEEIVPLPVLDVSLASEGGVQTVVWAKRSSGINFAPPPPPTLAAPSPIRLSPEDINLLDESEAPYVGPALIAVLV